MNETEKKEKLKSLNDRFVRWQQLLISQLSFTNNLILGFSLGFLSFIVSKQDGFWYCKCWHFLLFIFSIVSLLISFITGIMTVINRLNDFRCTKTLLKNRKIKFEDEHNIKKYNDIESISLNILTDKLLSDKLGKRTWSLLQWQIWSFAIGASLGIFYLVLVKM